MTPESRQDTRAPVLTLLEIFHWSLATRLIFLRERGQSWFNRTDRFDLTNSRQQLLACEISYGSKTDSLQVTPLNVHHDGRFGSEQTESGCRWTT